MSVEFIFFIVSAIYVTGMIISIPVTAAIQAYSGYKDDEEYGGRAVFWPLILAFHILKYPIGTLIVFCIDVSYYLVKFGTRIGTNSKNDLHINCFGI